MTNAEAIGTLLGSIVGAVLTGICIFCTKSAWACFIPLACYVIGGKIGKEIGKTKQCE